MSNLEAETGLCPKDFAEHGYSGCMEKQAPEAAWPAQQLD